MMPPSKKGDLPRFWGLFSGPLNSTLTVLLLALTVWLGPGMLRWLLLDAVWKGTAETCRAAAGACWPFLAAKLRFILFAFYPPETQWRPAIAIVLMLGLPVLTSWPRLWTNNGVKLLLLLWPATLATVWLLMAGGSVLQPVSPNSWGGLPVTLMVWLIGLALAVPLALLMALARQSKLAGLRLVSTVFIEVMRATPMVAILYAAMLVLPMALPAGLTLEKTSRALMLTTLFWAAYVAEVLRGGLQAIPVGQSEAATALGLGYWRCLHLVVLPQALRLVIPGLVNLGIGFLLSTSLLAVIGIFDLLNAAKAAATDPEWLGFYDEAYLFVAAIYFVLCFSGSRYSLWLERHLSAR